MHYTKLEYLAIFEPCTGDSYTDIVQIHAQFTNIVLLSSRIYTRAELNPFTL